MNSDLTVPSKELVENACRKFDKENEVVEKALMELFALYPSNRIESHVLLKVVTLNRLYSTGILAVHHMAAHIRQMADEIDSGLEKGSPEIVAKIAQISVGEKSFYFYSFASKYCSWHKQDLYPIYDSRVDKYLWSLKKQRVFDAEPFVKRSDLWDYSKFIKIMAAFKNRFGLNSYSFKAIDKFLWLHGETLIAKQPAAAADIMQPEPMIVHDGQISDVTEHEAMLNNELANRMSDLMAAEEARKLGVSEDEINRLILGVQD